jgi:DNA recombination protein RmuC
VQVELARLHAFTQARHDLERQTADAIRRLETVLAGTQTRGAAGENLLDLVFSKLPVAWQARNFVLGNKVVEFAIRLPNGLLLPIDSKWTATALIDAFATAGELDQQVALKRRIESAVLERARDVRKYLDPNLTVSFGVAVVPDTAYELSTGIHCDAFQMNVVVVGYSMLVPYLLLVINTISRSLSTVDLERLGGHVQTVEHAIAELQNEVEGRLSRAITMLGNARDDLRSQLGQVSGSLASIRTATGTLTATTDTPTPGLPHSARLLEEDTLRVN